MIQKTTFSITSAKNVRFTFLLLILAVFESTISFTQNCDSLFVPPCRINGINATQTSTGSVITFASAYSSCGLTTPANSAYIGSSGPFTYTLHLDKAVNEVSLVLTATGNPGEENFIFTTNAGSIPSVTSTNSCFSRIEGNEVISGLNSVPEGGGGLFSIRSKTPFTTMTITGNGGLNGTIMAFCATSLLPCSASFLTPTLSETKLTSFCFASSLNLNAIKAINLPPGLELTWHKDKVAKSSNQIKGNDVGNGFYYAAFFDKKNNCYSSNTTEVEVAIHLPPQVFAGKDLSICLGDSVFLNATGANSYKWSSDIRQNTYFKPKESSTYTVIGTDEKGCTNSAKVSVRVNQAPKIFAGTDLYITKGESITLKAEGAKSYYWSHGLYQGATFKPDSTITYFVRGIDENNCVNFDTLVVHVEAKKEIKLEEIPLENFNAAHFNPINVVFLLDISTSMIKHEKFDLLKYSVLQLLTILRPEDKIALVSFASNASVLLPLSHGNEKDVIRAEINKLTVSGKSAGTKGIKRGFKVAEKNFIPDGTNMVIILTDGAIGQDKEDYLKIISKYQKENILFSVVGIKNFPKDEEKMREAAQVGNGAYVPIFNYDDAKQNLILEIKERTFKKM